MSAQYRELGDELFARVEEILDEHADDLDYESNGEICEITLADGRQIVINRQPAQEEIWLAAKSGGFHFRHNGSEWADTRGGKPFFERLAECLG